MGFWYKLIYPAAIRGRNNSKDNKTITQKLEIKNDEISNTIFYIDILYILYMERLHK